MKAGLHLLGCLAAAVACAAGCGMTITGVTAALAGGGGGGGGAANAASTVVIEADRRVPGRRVELRIKAIDEESDPVSILVRHARAGAAAAAATLDRPGPVTGAALALASAPGDGVLHRIDWNADRDLPPGAHRDVQIVVSRIDPATLAPIGATVSATVTVGNDAPSVTLDPLPPEVTGALVIGFSLADSTGDAASARIEFALAASPTAFAEAEIAVGSTAGLATTDQAPGRRHTVAWRTDAPAGAGGIGRTIEAGVILRVTPEDEFGAAGAAVTATVDIVNNLRPLIRLDALDPTRDAGSPVPIAYTLFDEDGDPVDVLVEVTIDGAAKVATERPAGAGARSLSDGISGLAASEDGVAHRFLWDMRADVPTLLTAVRLKITPSDPFGPGVALVLPPLGLSSRFFFDLEQGREPGTADLQVAVLESTGLPSLAGVASGTLIALRQAPPALRAGFLRPEPLLAGVSPGVLISDVEGFRAGRFDVLAGEVVPEGIFAFNAANPGARFAVYHEFERTDGTPRFGREDVLDRTLFPAATVDAAAVGDLDGNGRDDVAVVFASPVGRQVAVYFATSATPTAFGLPVLVTSVAAPGPSSLAIFDVDGDGRRDLVAAIDLGTSGGQPLGGLLLAARNKGLGDGTIEAPFSTTDPLLADVVGVAGADVDGDGAEEAIASVSVSAGAFAAVRAYDAGAGAFVVTVSSDAGTFFAAADLDGDGGEEIVVAGAGGDAPEILKVRAATFERVADFPGERLSGARAGDFDRDGDVDLALLLQEERLALLFNAGNATFPERQELESPAGMEGLIARDLDLDGDLDLVAPDEAASNLLRNPGPVHLLAAAPIGSPLSGFGWGEPAAVDWSGDGLADIAAATGPDDTVLAGVQQGADGVIGQAVTIAAAAAGPIRSVHRVRRAGGGGVRDAVLVRVATDPARATAVVAALEGGSIVELPGPLTASRGMVAADLDGDGLDDLILIDAAADGAVEDALRVSLQAASGAFGAPVPLTAADVAVVRLVDLDGDAAADFIAGTEPAVEVWRGTAGAPGGETLVASLPDADFDGERPVDAALADVTGDGRGDVVAYWDAGPLSIHVQDAAGGFGTRLVVPRDPACGFVTSALVTALDTDGDGRREVVAVAQELCGADSDIRLIVASVGFDGSGLAATVTRTTLIAGTGGGDLKVGRPALRDFDLDGRADLAFSDGEALAAILLRGEGAEFRRLGDLAARESAIFEDVTGEGEPDLVARSPAGDLLVLPSVELRTAASASIGAAGGAVEAAGPPVAGARAIVPVGARASERTLAIVPARALDLPPVAGTALLAGGVFAATVHAPASPAVAFLPETETFPAAVTIELPVRSTHPAVAALLAGETDPGLQSRLKLFRFEREADGGRGRVVPVEAPIAVETDGFGVRRASTSVTRLGAYQLAIEGP